METYQNENRQREVEFISVDKDYKPKARVAPQRALMQHDNEAQGLTRWRVACTHTSAHTPDDELGRV